MMPMAPFVRGMTDAPDAGYEDQSAGSDFRKELTIVSGSARHYQGGIAQSSGVFFEQSHHVWRAIAGGQPAHLLVFKAQAMFACNRRQNLATGESEILHDLFRHVAAHQGEFRFAG